MPGYGKYQTDEEFFDSCARKARKDRIDEERADREWQEKRDEDCIRNLKERESASIES